MDHLENNVFFLGGELWVSRKGSMGWGEWRPGEFWVRKPGNLEWQRGTRSMDKIVKNLEKDEGFFRNGSENRVNHPKDSRNHIYIYTYHSYDCIYIHAKMRIRDILFLRQTHIGTSYLKLTSILCSVCKSQETSISPAIKGVQTNLMWGWVSWPLGCLIRGVPLK